MAGTRPMTTPASTVRPAVNHRVRRSGLRSRTRFMCPWGRKPRIVFPVEDMMARPMAAGAVGLAIMSSTGNTILGFLPQGHINLVLDLSPDLRTLWFTAGLTVLAGVVIGLVPAIQSTGN